MRDEYAVEDGANFDLKLPNNTFNKLFSPAQNLTEEDQQSLKMLKNFSFVNKLDKIDKSKIDIEDGKGKVQRIRLKKGQKLLL